MPKWFEQLGRIDELKKKEAQAKQRSTDLLIVHQVAVARQITQMREIPLRTTPAEQLTGPDSLARQRQEYRHTQNV